jgi:Domain of unknown function (DUF4332)
MTMGTELLDAIDEGKLRAADLQDRLRELPGAPAGDSLRTRYNLACGRVASDTAWSLRVLGDDSRRDPQPWALEDPTLAELRNGPHGAQFRAAIRRGCAAGDVRPLARLDLIGVSGSEGLARAGVRSVTDLVREGGPKDARDRLATTTGRSAGELKEWASLAELADIVTRAERGAGAMLARSASRAELAAMRAAQDEAVSAPEKRAAIDRRDTGRALDIANLLWLGGIGSYHALVEGTKADAPPSARGTAPTKPSPDELRVKALARSLTELNRTETVVALNGANTAIPFDVPETAARRWVDAAFDVPATRVIDSSPTPKPADAKAEDSAPK